MAGGTPGIPQLEALAQVGGAQSEQPPCSVLVVADHLVSLLPVL